ncbi:MAG: hypothetical protein IJ242_11190 [Clostridia bacterium]|nr:hypothetical protein [Clostridia bacterium]
MHAGFDSGDNLKHNRQAAEEAYVQKTACYSRQYLKKGTQIQTTPEILSTTLKEMAQHLVLVYQIMTNAIDTVPKARLCH